MKAIREVEYDILHVGRWVPVRECISGRTTMRPMITGATKGLHKARGMLYEIGGKEYVIHDGRWRECHRRCGVGDYEIVVDWR